VSIQHEEEFDMAASDNKQTDGHKMSQKVAGEIGGSISSTPDINSGMKKDLDKAA
jgi:hypothetical protein